MVGYITHDIIQDIQIKFQDFETKPTQDHPQFLVQKEQGQ